MNITCLIHTLSWLLKEYLIEQFVFILPFLFLHNAPGNEQMTYKGKIRIVRIPLRNLAPSSCLQTVLIQPGTEAQGTCYLPHPRPVLAGQESGMSLNLKDLPFLICQLG